MKQTYHSMKQAFSLLLVMTAGLSACVKDTIPPNPNEEELITTMQLTCIDSAGVQSPVTVFYRDLDGDGGNPPSTWDSIHLNSNTTYFASIRLLDESKIPADTISNEVLEEAHDHLFCYEINGVSCSVQATDQDNNGLPIGLQSKWKTGAAGSGNVRIILRHQPGIKTGSCTPGASDLDIPFQLVLN